MVVSQPYFKDYQHQMKTIDYCNFWVVLPLTRRSGYCMATLLSRGLGPKGKKGVTNPSDVSQWPLVWMQLTGL